MKFLTTSFVFALFCISTHVKSNDNKDKILSNDSVIVQTISKKEYFASKNYNLQHTVTQDIHKENNVYCLNVGKTQITLKDTLEEDDSLYKKYQFLGYYESVNLLCFTVYEYETSTTLLVNALTGDMLEIFGVPIFSPKGNFIINASQILNYDQIPNIIQIWHIENNVIKLFTEYQPEEWIPEGFKWINDFSFVFTKKYENNTEKYSKVTIR